MPAAACPSMDLRWRRALTDCALQFSTFAIRVTPRAIKSGSWAMVPLGSSKAEGSGKWPSARLAGTLAFAIDKLPDFGDHDRSLADGGGHPLDRSCAHVAYREDAWQRGGEGGGR